ncbi:MAG: hypothetical protein IH608_01085 [Proteobacteria bacterium]|nr:hypothetical protein [Pseudomonadota bacterium]
MNRKDLVYLAGFVVLATLLLGNLFKPDAPQAFTLPEAVGPAVAISSSGDSAWAIVGNRVYFVSLKNRGEIPNKTITVIDDEELR